MGSPDTGAREPQPNAEALARRIKIALDLGLQAWRSTPSRSRFHEAFDALNALLAAGVGVARPAEPDCSPPLSEADYRVAENDMPEKLVGAPAEEQPDARARAEFALSNENGPPGVLALGRDVLGLLAQCGLLREQLDAARQALEAIADYAENELHSDEEASVFASRAARAALGDVAAGGYAADGSTLHKSDEGGALDQRAVESRGGES